MEAPKITHLGMVQGEWPVYAFTSQESAADWAAIGEQRRVWPIVSIELGGEMRGMQTLPVVYLESVNA